MKAFDREYLDLEGVILMTCRQTKRGDELRRVELPKSFSNWKHGSLFHKGNTAEDIHGLVGSSWKRDKGTPKERLGKEQPLRSSRI